MYFSIDQQMLIYIRDKIRIRKSRVIKAIEIWFTLFGKMKELSIFAFTGYAINEISESIVYTTLRVSNKAKKNH